MAAHVAAVFAFLPHETGAQKGPDQVVEESQLLFIVGFRVHGTTGHLIVQAEDGFQAAFKVKTQRPGALITYVRRQNKRGDARRLRQLANRSNVTQR
jgi:hypothetical protein